MTSQEFYEKLVAQQTQDLFLEEDHLLQRVTAGALSKSRVRRKVPMRKTFVTAVILAVIFSLGCITAVAVTVFHLPDLAVQMGMDPENLSPDSHYYGIFDRYFTQKLAVWNEEREAAGLEPMNADLLTQMVSAGDMTVEEVYQLYGRVPLSEKAYQQVQEKYGEIDTLEAELSSVKEMMDRLFWAEKNGERTLTEEETSRLSDYQEKQNRVQELRRQMSEELQALESGINAPDRWTKEVPAQWKIPEKLENEEVIRDILSTIGGQLDGYGTRFSQISPTYDLVHTAARNAGIEQNSDRFAVPQDLVEEQVRWYFGDDAQVSHESSGEGTDLEIRYLSGDGSYTGLWEKNTGYRFPCLLHWEKEGDETVVRVVFVTVTEQPEEGDIYYYLDENRNILASFSSRFDGLSEYQVQQMADSLPQWEYRFQKVKGQDDGAGASMDRVVIRSVQKIK